MQSRQATTTEIPSVLTDKHNRKLKRKAKGAMTIIQDIAATLPPTAPMVNLCNQLSGASKQVF